MIPTRRSISRWIVAALLCCVVLGSVSAAGAQTKTPTKKWASGVCSAVQTWLDDLDSTVQDLKNAGSIDDAATQAKSGLKSATDQLEQSLDALGRPQSTDGKKAQKAVQELQKDLEAVGSTIDEALAEPPSGAVAIAATFAEIGTQLGKASKDLENAATAVKGLDPGGDLEKAIQNSSSCQKLKKSL